MMYQRDASRALYVIGYMWRFTGMVHVWCVEIPCDECWCMNVDEWMNDECWCMNVDEWMMNVDEWMNEWLLMNEWWMLMDERWMNDECWRMNDERIWVLMHVDECEMYVEWCMMHLWCVMHWCMLNRWMCVKCMYIFCNHNYILYWFCNCFNVLILIFVFVCLSGFLYLICIMYMQ